MTASPAWIELRWTLPRQAAEPASAALFDLGALGVQEDYLPGQAPPPRQPWDTGPRPPEPPLVLLRAWWEAAAAPDTAPLLARWGGEVDWATVEAEDWANQWRDHFVRVAISDRLAVAPPWDAQPGDVILEPGMAFGSGDHPTTHACLVGIDRHATPGGRCLDVGCGSGILAIAAAKLGMQVEGIDIDPECVRTSTENAALNHLSAAFSETPLARLQGTHDLVVANVYAEVLVTMAPDLARLCAPGGVVVLAGILADRDHLVLDAMQHAGLQVVRREQAGEWVSLELVRPAIDPAAG